MTRVSPAERISEEYRREQVLLHEAPRGYGGRGVKWLPVVDEIVTTYAATSVLDYGCGQGSLGAGLRALRPALDVREYDPAIHGKWALPAPADLVVCTDVLEHVEPESVGAVLAHLRELSLTACFVVISLVETAKQLSDGRQAHISLHPVGWWLEQAAAVGFEVATTLTIKPEKQWCGVWRGRRP